MSSHKLSILFGAVGHVPSLAQVSNGIRQASNFARAGIGPMSRYGNGLAKLASAKNVVPSLVGVANGIGQVNKISGVMGTALDAASLAAGAMNPVLFILGTAAGVAGAALFDLTKEGFNLNAQLENQAYGLAGNLGMMLQWRDANGGLLLGQTAFNKNLEVSNKLLDEFDKVALKAPGTAQELANVFNGVLNPGIAAGKDLKTLIKFSNQSLTVGKILSQEADKTSTDMNAILSGHAGNQMLYARVIGPQIRMMATDFNKLPGPERFQLVQRAIASIATPSVIKSYTHQWKELNSTLGEFRQGVAKRLGKSAFIEVERGLGKFVDFLTSKETTSAIFGVADALGDTLGGGIRWVVDAAGNLVGFWKSDIAPMFVAWSPVVEKLWGMFMKLGQGIDSFLSPVLNTLWNGILKPGIGIWWELTKATNNFWAALFNGDNTSMMNATLAFFKALQPALTSLGKTLEGIGAKVGNFFSNSVDSMLVRISDAIEKIASIPKQFPWLAKFLGIDPNAATQIAEIAKGEKVGSLKRIAGREATQNSATKYTGIDPTNRILKSDGFSANYANAKNTATVPNLPSTQTTVIVPTSPLTVNVHQEIVSANPAEAAQRANAGVGSAVKRATTPAPGQNAVHAHR